MLLIKVTPVFCVVMEVISYPVKCYSLINIHIGSIADELNIILVLCTTNKYLLDCYVDAAEQEMSAKLQKVSIRLLRFDLRKNETAGDYKFFEVAIQNN